MKKTILSVTMLLITHFVLAQAYFTVTSYIDYRANDENASWIFTRQIDEASMLTLNEKGTVITHTKSEATSTYFILETNTVESKNLIMYQVLSADGKKISIHFDFKERAIKFIGIHTNGDGWMRRYSLKSVKSVKLSTK